jgi:hypothetical protein
MSDLGQHLMFRSDDDRVLAPSPAQRRALARAVYRVARDVPLAAFGAADNHLHVELLTDRATAGTFAHALSCSLRWTLNLPVKLAPTRFKRLEDHRHERSTFHYALNQRNHHGVYSDPFLDACSLPELLGMRLLPTASVALVAERFPRLHSSDLLRHIGMPELTPARDGQVMLLLERDRHDLLRDAAAGAVGRPNLSSKKPEEVAANTALVHVLSAVCPPRQTRDVVERSSARVRHMRATPAAPQLVHAIRLQLALRIWLLEHSPDLLTATPHRLPQA